MTTWEDLSFIGNFAAAADALGIDGIGIAWGVAHGPFSDIKDGERFINALVMMPRTGEPTSLVNESQKAITYQGLQQPIAYPGGQPQ